MDDSIDSVDRSLELLVESVDTPSDVLRGLKDVDMAPRAAGLYPRESDTEAGVQAALFAASDALELLSNTYGTRSHSMGLILRDEALTLWYYDAAGVIYTSEYVSIFSQFEAFAAIVIGLACCTPEQLGVFMPSSLVDSPYKTLEYQQITYEGVHISLQRPISAQHTLAGTHPVLCSGTWNSFLFPEIVVKLSYPLLAGEREADLVQIAPPKKISNMPEILRCLDFWSLSDGAREAFLQNSEGQAIYEDRTLRAIIYPPYRSIRELFADRIDLVPVMVDQMIDCEYTTAPPTVLADHRRILGLYDLFYKARILHRNINIDNIVYERDGHRHVFRLIDFDMAILVPEDGNQPTYSDHRMGSWLFIAHELILHASHSTNQDCGFSEYLLRYDVESLFWTSLYSTRTVLRHRLPEVQVNLLLDDVRGWESGTDLAGIAARKRSICLRPVEEWDVGLPEPAEALEPWFNAWTGAFARAAKEITDHNTSRPRRSFDIHTAGDVLSRKHLKASLAPFLPDEQGELTGRSSPHFVRFPEPEY